MGWADIEGPAYSFLWTIGPAAKSYEAQYGALDAEGAEFENRRHLRSLANLGIADWFFCIIPGLI